jgi:uncharacterized protein
MLIDRLMSKQLIHPPSFLPSNTHYLTIMGSQAYGVADTSVKEKLPDTDVYGFCIPPKDYIFPHLRGEIPGFGTPGPTFDQWQQHHIIEADQHAGRGQEWDLTIFGIVKYFELCRENNPNIIDSLFTPITCVIHATHVGQLVRDNRRLFLSKLAWKKFRGYAWSQLHKMDFKNPEGGRREIVDKFGYDVKFAYHVVRLLDEAEQILFTGDLDLQRAREAMKSIRRGEWKIEDIRAWAMEKEKALEAAYVSCSLPEFPAEEPIKKLLLHCLEQHYGSIDAMIQQPEWARQGLQEIDQILGRLRSQIYQ